MIAPIPALQVKDIVTHARRPGRWVVRSVEYIDPKGRPLRVTLVPQGGGPWFCTWAEHCRPAPECDEPDTRQGDLLTPVLTTP